MAGPKAYFKLVNEGCFINSSFFDQVFRNINNLAGQIGGTMSMNQTNGTAFATVF